MEHQRQQRKIEIEQQIKQLELDKIELEKKYQRDIEAIHQKYQVNKNILYTLSIINNINISDEEFKNKIKNELLCELS
jgi:hypothetical protein